MYIYELLYKYSLKHIPTQIHKYTSTITNEYLHIITRI